MIFDYVIVGSGFAGAVLAERIATELDKKVLIIEKRKHIGGNCFDFKDENNIIIHKYGPHIFHTNDKEVFNYICKFTNIRIFHHKVLAYIDGKKVPIPFNFNTLYQVFPDTLAKRIEKKLLEKYELNSKVSILELQSEEDSDLKLLSNFIFQKIFLNYTVKQWGLTPDEIDKSVMSRVPVFMGKDNRYFTDKYQFIPTNGYTSLFNKMLNNKNIKIMLQTDFHEIAELKKNKFFIFGNEFKGKVIYSGAIDELFGYRFGELPYRSLKFEPETVNTEYYQETAQVNYPNDYDFTRITEFKHFHNVKSNDTVIFREYPEKFKRGKNSRFYPVLTEKNLKLYQKYRIFARKYKNLILIGRLAEYKYYNMDEIIKKSLEIFQNKILPEERENGIKISGNIGNNTLLQPRRVFA